MISLGHLETYKLKIRTLAPVFIGSGVKLVKREYLFQPNGHQVFFVQFEKLIAFLERKGLLNSYEKYMLGEHGNIGLFEWLSRQKVTQEEFKQFIAYGISAGDALESGSFREIYTFIKNSQGKPYLPGSSIKGALRTALAAKMIRDKRQEFTQQFQGIEEEADRQKRGKYYLQKQADSLEKSLFRKLNLLRDRRWADAVNDLMRGVQVSDSLPFDPENLVLCVKIDRGKDGRANIKKDSGLLFRECIKPDTEIEASLTLDKAALKQTGITLEYLLKALQEFDQTYRESFESVFQEVKGDAPIKVSEGVPLLLGGGIGFASKTLIYPLAKDRTNGVKLVSKILHKQFDKHKHDKDVALGVSPHRLKITKCNQKYYPMGRCEVIINKQEKW